MHQFRRHAFRVFHAGFGVALLVREECEEPAVEVSPFADIDTAVAAQLVHAHLPDDALPEDFLRLAFRRFNELFQNRCQTVGPCLQTEWLQQLCLCKHLLPIFGSAFEFDVRYAADYVHGYVSKIRFHGFHQRNPRSNMLHRSRCREIFYQRLGQLSLGVLHDGRAEAVDQCFPVQRARHRVAGRFNHQVNLAFVVHQQVAHFFGMRVHVARESLADAHPDHVRRQHQRPVSGIGFDHRTVESVLLQITEFLLIVETGRHDLRRS